MAHHINLAIQTLSKLPLVMHLENLLQCLFSYFSHSPKRHLEFTKLAKSMATKGNKIIWIVKLRWILMLNLAKKSMVEYKTFLVKMTLDNPINQQAMLNYTFVTSNFNFAWTCVHFSITRIYACSHQVCTIQRCVQVCDLEITSQILVSNFLQYVKLVELTMVELAMV